MFRISGIDTYPKIYAVFKYKHRLFFIKFLYLKTISLPIRADSAFLAADNPIPLVAAKNALTESAVNCVPRKKVSVLVFNYSQF